MVEVIRHATLEECMAEFFGCAPDDLPRGRWEWVDGDRFRVWPMSRVLRTRRKLGTWGWCESKGRIHLWVADHAEPARVARLVGHELGHMQRPFRRLSVDEEAKAERYADFAQLTFEIVQELLS